MFSSSVRLNIFASISETTVWKRYGGVWTLFKKHQKIMREYAILWKQQIMQID